jgi:hypothetical protein
MNLTVLFIATCLVILLATGLLIWVWLAIAEVEEDLRGFNGFEGIHFEVCPPAAADTASSGITHPLLKPSAFMSAWRKTANRVAGILVDPATLRNSPGDR